MLITDASQVGMGAVLCQLREGFLRPIRYISNTFNASQRNYTTTERECLPIIESIKILRPILFGSKFIVLMDHAALKHLREFKDLSSRVMRYALRMKKLVELLSHFRGLHPFAQVFMDFIGPLDQTRSGNRYILLLVDHNTHLDVAVPLPDSSAERVGIILLKELFYKFGLPNILGFDKAWYWITEMLKNAYERLQIFKKTSSSYHPQNSGLVENTNSTLMRMLKKMHNRCEDWDILLDEVLFFYNTTPKKSFKGLSPFEWLYGFSPRFMNQKMKKIISEFMTEEAFDRCVETRQDLLLRTPELVQDVIVEKAEVVEQLNENQDRLPSRALFHKDALVFLDKYPLYPDKPSKLEPRY